MSALIEDKTIFFLGATGYIGELPRSTVNTVDVNIVSSGSAVFSKLLQYKKQYPITALSRSDEKVELLNKLRDNVKGLKGSLSDLELLEEQASKHDIIFNTADADDVSHVTAISEYCRLTISLPLCQLKATKALLKGMAKRKAETGHRPVYIHTSGTGVLADVSDDYGFVGRELTQTHCIECCWQLRHHEDLL